MRKILFLSIGTINYDCDVNFYEPLKQIFPNVINYNYIQRAQEVGEPAMNREILDLVFREKPECVFLHAYRNEIYKSTMRQISSNGITTLVWFSDDHWRFDDYSRFWGEVIHYSVTTDHGSIRRYNALGIPVILSQWAANPDYYHPIDCDQTIDVSFIGARTPSREALIEGLSARGVKVETFGQDWKRGYVSFQDMVRIFSCSRINLNYSAFWGGTEIKQIKGRVFEVVMSGGLLLTDYIPDLEHYFVIGKEILCYKSVEEATAIILYYLSHEEERRAIAAAGYQRALCDHNWKVRLQQLFGEVELREANVKRSQVQGSAIHSVKPIEESIVCLSPQTARILDAHVRADGKMVFRTVDQVQVAISQDDLRDGIIYIILNGTGVEWTTLSEQEFHQLENRDLIFVPKVVDQLDVDQANQFWSKCAQSLAPDGLLIGYSRLWYASDRKYIPGHKHRGFRSAYTPTQLKQQLLLHFNTVELVEIHRPLGPMGPYVAFFAAHQPERLRAIDVQRVKTALEAIAKEFAENERSMSLTWSGIHHDSGHRREAMRLAWKICQNYPWKISAWKTLLRAFIGQSVWQRIRRVVKTI